MTCNDQCVWKKRFMDIVRENEKIKQKYREVSYTRPKFILSFYALIPLISSLYLSEPISNGNTLLELDVGKNWIARSNLAVETGNAAAK